ncbi:uncharacterized protein LOC119103415 [Pollicipes pollicipes]|uniref:uncharacterized protein LOC119103415 n=1 Tax=Pollicipes pollicipes TaxID=41117 RepID=UPI0018849316|nr:uncharacterized protein LOC119103415 [Pollicipes pollicipes]
MNSTLLVLTALLAVAVAMPRPRYALVPIEDLRYLAPRVRVPRQVQVADPQPHYLRQVPQPSEDRFVRQAGGDYGGDQVDYGAYTGGYGAFGWYADYPVGGGGYHR